VHTKYDSFVFLSSSEEFFSLEECSNWRRDGEGLWDTVEREDDREEKHTKNDLVNSSGGRS
jgi:hypothetical protein